MSSDAQKKAYKKYNKKKKTFSVVYTPSDINEGLRLENYLNTISISKNEYLKGLIKADLDAKGIGYPESEQRTWDTGHGIRLCKDIKERDKETVSR